jgi:hypothetical protein
MNYDYIQFSLFYFSTVSLEKQFCPFLLKLDQKEGHGNLLVSIIDTIHPIAYTKIRNGPSILIAKITQNTPKS